MRLEINSTLQFVYILVHQTFVSWYLAHLLVSGTALMKCSSPSRRGWLGWRGAAPPHASSPEEKMPVTSNLQMRWVVITCRCTNASDGKLGGAWEQGLIYSCVYSSFRKLYFDSVPVDVTAYFCVHMHTHTLVLTPKCTQFSLVTHKPRTAHTHKPHTTARTHTNHIHIHKLHTIPTYLRICKI